MLELSGLTIGLRHHPDRRPLVDDLGLSVTEGETVALVGESGSGKSITALSMVGLLTSWHAASPFRVSGTLTIGDQTLHLGTARDRDFDRVRGSSIAMIFQDPWSALDPIVAIGRQLVESIRLDRTVPADQRRSRALELLDRVGIGQPKERFHSYPHQLSGGQLQRVMIAMALAGRPQFLVADEPTTALDVTVQAGILQLLDELRRDGMGILLITHDLSVVAQHATVIRVMYDGAIIESGPARAVIRQPRHPYTRLLISSVPTRAMEPRTPLITKADVVGGRYADPEFGRFDPNQRDHVDERDLGERHLVSTRYTAEVEPR